jgi:hypothetical protein
MNLVRLSAAALVATVALASSARAQVAFYTQGYFTSPTGTCNQAAPVVGSPVGASCVHNGFTLNYTAAPQNPNGIASGSIVSFGQFSLLGTGSATVPPSTVDFTMLIQQTAPTIGTGTLMGYISGTVAVSPDLSTFVWRPTAQTLNIGEANYTLIYDNVGPGANTGLGLPIDQTRGINAYVTTVPEPSTYLLMASGMAGMLAVARRRRQV